MPSLIEKLREDYASRRKQVTILGIDVWVTPLTVDEQNKVNAKHPNDGGLRLAEILVLKCRTEDGQPIFTADDKVALKREVAGDRLGPLIAAIQGAPAEEQAKNSEAIG